MPKTRVRVLVARGNRLVAKLVCKRCASGAVPLLLAQPQIDPTLCVECKAAPARLCEGCNLQSRKASARQALAAVRPEVVAMKKLEPKEDL